ncbi:MAG: 4-diphosphocytidyl-2-C-methyl-D-erythritol kinase [Phycisphaerae bacterium]|jgi:4-diphosphocytidyl-2-C-methyl-D-erythritol kinase|nr:MAG: 4-diphosphocytidyl-2-C-methyl-D-erythritol kinase [Phycisphaerae bacterium]
MRVYSPAKINLYLRVGPKRPDGFHPVVSWMVTVGLFDRLDFVPDRTGRVELHCSDPSLATDQSNLVVRAARGLQAELTRRDGGDTSWFPFSEISVNTTPPTAGSELPGVQVYLDKIIPMGGGLGGGSSNAAVTLLTLNHLWNLNLSRQNLIRIASEIGSDVPFFIEGPSCLCQGRGEILTPLPVPRVTGVVLIFPPICVPTREVYQRFDQLPVPGNWDQAVESRQWANLSAEDLLRVLQNDLEPPAFSLFPELRQLKDQAETCLSRPVRMSGSGSTLFSLYDDFEHAEQDARKIQSTLRVRTSACRIAVTNEVNG